MSGGSVPAHMTDANDAADEGGAPQSEQKRAQAPLESHFLGGFRGVNHSYFLLFFSAQWMQKW